MTDGDQLGAVELSGADALARSTELVSGRWWGTAFTVAISFVATGVIVPLYSEFAGQYRRLASLLSVPAFISSCETSKLP